ncbi:MAG: helicase C-terminal domain-containing protein [Verrucomicrobiota bacterium]|nr:helicase C-terminal domain-containing protein [Verrucomicrobiota bacterium]
MDLLKATSEFFADDSPLKNAVEYGGGRYEERPQQTAMAEKIAEVLNKGEHLCVEAPTGIGKSFAYLVPALFYAHSRKETVLVSTHTISLQEQLIEKDLHILKNLLPFEINAVLAKGRGNYVCLKRLFAAHQDPDEMLFSNDTYVDDIDRIAKFCKDDQESHDGSRTAITPIPSFKAWHAVNCAVGTCSAGHCSHFNDCYLQKARRKLSKADIIVANHSLLFADLAMKNEPNNELKEGVLPQYEVVILDEGHSIEETASTHFGFRLSVPGFFYMLKKIYDPKYKKGIISAKFYASEHKKAVEHLQKAAESFFSKILDWVLPQKENPLRYTVPGHIPNMLRDELDTVRNLMNEILKVEKDPDKKTQLKGLLLDLTEFAINLEAFLDMTVEGFVYWFELSGYDKQQLIFQGVPIEVHDILKPVLFHNDFKTIITSATLAVKNDLNYYLKRIGGEKDVNKMILSSPFDFQKQVELFIPFEMPSPKDYKNFMEKVAEHISTFMLKTKGRAFILFTSYKMLRETAETLEDFFKKEGIQLLIQGGDYSRKVMIKKFKEDVSSVIFGTSSFWAGVDVPGEALSCVIIVKLPFSVPTHPLNAARFEKIEKQRKSPFQVYSLPEAVLKFRQGFGRLIRTKDDNGIIVVLDNRIIKSGYGRTFLDSIPECKRTMF